MIFEFFSCTSRYVGEHCEYSNPCLTAPRCQNGGTCEVLIKDGHISFQCKCPVGFSASLCEIAEETACSSFPCRNTGKCISKTLKEYECKCPEGFTGKFEFGSVWLDNKFKHFVEQEKIVKSPTYVHHHHARMVEHAQYYQV